MKQLIAVFRHGEYGTDSSSPLTERGRNQIRSLRNVIDAAVAKRLGADRVGRVLFSASRFTRAVQSITAVAGGDEDIVLLDIGVTERHDMPNMGKILSRIVELANHHLGDRYAASVILIVGHADLPQMLAEAAYEVVKGQEVGKRLPCVSTACGYLIDMSTGDSTAILYNELDEKKPAQPPRDVFEQKKPSPSVGQESNRPVLRGGPPRTNGPVIRGGPKYEIDDDDIPF